MKSSTSKFGFISNRPVSGILQKRINPPEADKSPLHSDKHQGIELKGVGIVESGFDQ